MESGALELRTAAAPDRRVQGNGSLASLRRLAWAQSKDSTWTESEQERPDPQGPEKSDGNVQGPSEGTGQVPNKITSWLNECGTPIGASLDDQSASPSRGAARNGCSFEDDLSLGAEANHLHATVKKTDSCFGLAAEEKRSQFKERGRSMNSTGSGKSSTVSRDSNVSGHTEEHLQEVLLTLRVSELLDLYEEDPEEVLLNLGFGREEPDLASKVPSRFLNGSSAARGIDIKVYLGAQMQRMELENPNYALTSRFRQIEVLTNVANEFFQLYSQVSGQPVECINTKEQGGDGGEERGEKPVAVFKRGSSARDVAKFLKKTITRHNLLAATPAASTEDQKADPNTQLNGHNPPDNSHTNSHTHDSPQQDNPGTNPEHQAEAPIPKHLRKKDSCFLATVTEENNGDGEVDAVKENSPEQSTAEPPTNGEHQPEPADVQSPIQKSEDGSQVVEEKSLTSTPVKAPHSLAPLQLAQLRTEKADSFDMEEIQSNDDEGLPHRFSRATDLSRTVSQQSDSSGFAEEPSADSFGYLKVQESCDSCDSETTVTSHPSQDVATPLAVDQPAFDLPDCRVEEPATSPSVEVSSRSSSKEEEEDVPAYTAHNIPKERPMLQEDSREEEEPAVGGDWTDPDKVTASELGTKQEAEAAIEQEKETEIGIEQEKEPETESEQNVVTGIEQINKTEPDTESEQNEETGIEQINKTQPDTESEQNEETGIEQINKPEPEPLMDQERESEIEREQETELTRQLEIEPVPETETENPFGASSVEAELHHSQNYTETTTDTEPSTERDNPKCESQDSVDIIDVRFLPVPSSPVLCALNRAKRNYRARTRPKVNTSDNPEGVTRGRGRRSIPIQRSSSLPSSLPSPTRVVSSVRIQFGQGQASCTPPRYSFRYNQNDGEEEKEVQVEAEKEDSQTKCLSTLHINPVPSSASNSQTPRPAADAPIPPKPIPRHLLRSSCSLNSTSPPPDMSPGDHGTSWSSQSIPDLTYQQHSPGRLHHNISQHQRGLNPGQMLFPHPVPTPNPQYINPSPTHIPSLNASPYPVTVNPHLPYPSPLQPYASLPNLHNHYNHSMSHHSSMSSLHHHMNATIPLHGSLSNLHQPPSPYDPNITLGHLHPESPLLNHPGYSHAFSHQSLYPPTPHSSQFSSPYPYPPYSTNPHLAYPHHVPHQYPPVPPQYGLHPSVPPPAPGFLPGLTSDYSQSLHSLNSLHSLHGRHPAYPPPPPSAPPLSGSGPSQVLSRTEMQLRKVLHDIRGTVMSLNQNQPANSLDSLSEATSGYSTQSLAEFQQKRQNLQLFRSQMTDLELSLIRQQALVYNHLSPADRLEVEQLQSLRSAVREQLQELEQQLEEKLTHNVGLHRDNSVDNLSSNSALRAMEPVSDLLREQLSLQSELSYGGHTPSTAFSTRSSSPVPEGGRESEQRQGVYRTSINITPVPPPRTVAQMQEEEEEEEEERGRNGGGRERGTKTPVDESAGGVSADNLQQLIREIRENVAQEIRREIYSELLAAVSPGDSSLPNRPHFL